MRKRRVTVRGRTTVSKASHSTAPIAAPPATTLRTCAGSVVARGLATNDLVEVPQQLFALGVRSGCVDARADAGLRLLGDPPVLAIGDVPELDGIVDLRVRPGELVRMEVPLADDLGAVVRARPERVRHHVIGMAT